MLSAMILLATNAHSGQFDRGGRPYILHCMAVMHKLRSDDEELQCIAIGHDVIEDTKTTYKQLKDIGMTDRVIEGIRALTKVPGESYDDYKLRVFANRDAMLVKSKDLMHNSDLRRLKGVTQKDVERTAKYMTFFAEIQEKLANP